MTDTNRLAEPGSKPGSWLMFFFRPVLMIPVTVFLLVIVAA